jgi:hypothetical protein
MDKFTKLRDDEQIQVDYQWLCDAVHPSMGSGAVFALASGMHEAKVALRVRVARRAIEESGSSPTNPNVAWACDSIVLAASHVKRQAERIRWLINDIGITSRAAYSASVPLIGTFASRPGRNGALSMRLGPKSQELPT